MTARDRVKVPEEYNIETGNLRHENMSGSTDNSSELVLPGLVDGRQGPPGCYGVHCAGVEDGV
jgi:hypothetical protein